MAGDQRRVGSLSRAGAAVRLVDLLFTYPFITIPGGARFLDQTAVRRVAPGFASCRSSGAKTTLPPAGR
jgi:hypothetical protein